MKDKSGVVLWLMAIVSLPLSLYLFISGVFYVWVDEVNPAHAAAAQADGFAIGAFVLCVLSFLVFIYALVSLIRRANRKLGASQ